MNALPPSAACPLRLLLVDDDPQVLNALRRRISRLREGWVVVACQSVEQAVESMRSDPPDAFVTDLKMTGQMGTALLAHARAMRSTCFRVVLSGCAEQDLVMGSLDLCHRFFPKPCDAEALVEAVEAGVEDLRHAMPPDLRVWVAVSKSLPAVSRLYQRILSLINDPASNVEMMSAVIEQEPAIAARLLRAANCAYFGTWRGVSSVQEAMGIIGMDAVTSMVLGCELLGAASSHGWQEKVWQHSVQTAALARQIASQIGADVDASFTAALLHDVGKIILADVLGYQAWQGQLAEGKAKGQIPWVAEESSFGTAHSAVGGLLFDIWGLPEKIVQAVRWHHQPSRCPATASRCAAVVHLSNALAHAWTSAPEEPFVCDALWLESCGIPSSPESYASLREIIEDPSHA